MNNKILHALFAQPDAFEFVTLSEEKPARRKATVGSAILSSGQPEHVVTA
jgi:hypothetical protein